MSGVAWSHALEQGWPVLSVLSIMSILSLAVILERLQAFRRARIDADRFIRDLYTILRDGTSQDAVNFCSRYRQPLAVACAAVVAKPGNRSARERALRHAVHDQVHRLEAYIPALATIASTAPFIGLFGTVIGVIRAFQAIATTRGAGPDVVAAGISEALVSTAAGIFVAVPALAAYNYFVRRLHRLVAEIDLAAYDVLELVSPPAEVNQ
jgi:biopolymer transport protein ExbB/TolQ